MTQVLRVLIVEDSSADLELLLHELRRAGFEPDWQQIDSEADFVAKLDEHAELVLADYYLPGFGAPRALELLGASGLDIPLLVVSGSVPDELAIECMRSGAADYLLKDRLGRLGHAVRAALEGKRLRDEQRRAQARLSFQASLLEAVGQAVIATDAEGRITYWNRAAEALYGWTSDEVLGQLITSVTPAPASHAEAERILASLRRGRSWRGEFLVRRRDGSEFPARVTDTPILDEHGRLVGIVGISEDVSERLHAEQARHRSDAKLRAIVENSPDVIFIKDRDGRFVLANPACARAVGLTPGQLVGKTDEELFDPQVAAETRAIDREIMVSRVPCSYERTAAYGGVERTFHNIKVPYVSDAGELLGIIGISRDVSARKAAEETLRQTEEQLRQSQKMEAIGRLAGGVAHDFNNLLTAITGYGELLLERLPSGDSMRHDVEEILKASDRATSLTQQLLAFSRRQVLQPRVLELNRVVLGMEHLLRRLIGEDIELVLSLEPELGRVQADPGQLEQVLLNLVVNARDAMPGGGQLVLRTAGVELGETALLFDPPVPAGPYVLLSVSDTGCGMSAEVRSHIFEPFFTTKEQGKGTGLGLPTVYGIVRQSGGSVAVHTAPHGGTVFEIYLPRVEGASDSSGARSSARGAQGGSETVLLVEDEPLVRQLARTILQNLGYAVVEAASPHAALELSRTHQGPVHLLLTDVVMPGMSGCQLADSLHALRPHMRVLYMSGYTDSAVVHRGVLEPDTPFLQKPFTPDALARAVRSALC